MGKIEGRRRREEPRMRCLDGITNSMDMSLSTGQEIMKNREDWHVSVMGSQSRTWLSDWITILWKETFNFPIYFLSVQFILVTQSCPSLCDPMDCSMSCLPVHHQLPEFTETHIHWAEKATATHSSTLAWKIPWTEEPGRLQPWGHEESDMKSSEIKERFHFHFHFQSLEKEMATHSSFIAWGIPGMAETDGLPSMGLQGWDTTERLNWIDAKAPLNGYDAISKCQNALSLPFIITVIQFPNHWCQRKWH